MRLVDLVTYDILWNLLPCKDIRHTQLATFCTLCLCTSFEETFVVCMMLHFAIFLVIGTVRVFTIIHIKSIKTTSMENVITGAPGKIKNNIFEVKMKPKNNMMYQDIYNCICQNTKNEDILSIMSNLQPNCCLKVDVQKVDQHAGAKWLIHDTKRRKNNQSQSPKLPTKYRSWVTRCDIKGSDGTMLNPSFWKKVQGQNILGGERLQNTKYLVSKCCLKQISIITSILVLD